MGQAPNSRVGCLCGLEGDTSSEVEERLAHVRDFGEGEPIALQRAQATLGAALGALDPRRRLSVGAARAHRAAADASTVRAGTAGDGLLERAGLREFFGAGVGGQRRAVALWSVTDTEGGASFKEKCEEVLCPEGREDQEGALVHWLQDLGIGWACKKGLKPDSPNQDSFSILAVEDTFILIGVYDGHGPKGHDVSQFARQQVVKGFMTHPKRTSDTEAAFHDSFLACQELMEQSPQLDALESGTTCTMVYVDLLQCQLTVAHVGDARGILGRRRRAPQGMPTSGELECDELTVDHKPNLEKEKKRIESATPPGRVLFDGYVNYRVFTTYGMYPGLNMSRALGDVFAHREAGLCAVPDTRTVPLRPLLGAGDELTLLVCTDGVWEFIPSAEALRLAAEVAEAGSGGVVNRLARESWDRWIHDSEGEVCDDITAVCVRLHTALAPRRG